MKTSDQIKIKRIFVAKISDQLLESTNTQIRVDILQKFLGTVPEFHVMKLSIENELICGIR